MCQPGLPLPQGLGQDGSPGFDAFHRAKSIGLSFWSDMALFGHAGIPSILYGPVGHGAHAVDEWVSLKSLVRVYETLKGLIAAY